MEVPSSRTNIDQFEAILKKDNPNIRFNKTHVRHAFDDVRKGVFPTGEIFKTRNVVLGNAILLVNPNQDKSRLEQMDKAVLNNRTDASLMDFIYLLKKNNPDAVFKKEETFKAYQDVKKGFLPVDSLANKPVKMAEAIYAIDHGRKHSLKELRFFDIQNGALPPPEKKNFVRPVTEAIIAGVVSLTTIGVMGASMLTATPLSAITLVAVSGALIGGLIKTASSLRNIPVIRKENKEFEELQAYSKKNGKGKSSEKTKVVAAEKVQKQEAVKTKSKTPQEIAESKRNLESTFKIKPGEKQTFADIMDSLKVNNALKDIKTNIDSNNPAKDQGAGKGI